MVDNHLEYENFLKGLRNKVKEEMDARGLTQTQLENLCHEKNLNITQSTISSILTGSRPVALKTYLNLFDVLGLSAFENQKKQEAQMTATMGSVGELIDSLLKVQRETLLTNPDSIYFNGLLGEYYCYFHPTNKSENDLLEGRLTLRKVKDICKAELLLENHKQSGNAYSKKYEGFLVVSPLLNAAYCLLIAPEIGELNFFSFWHKSILSKSTNMGCRMASVCTVSSGVDERLSTLHRMFISRERLSDVQKKSIRGQLRLNKSRILISEEGLEALKASEAVSDEFLNECLEVAEKEVFYTSTESVVLPDKESVKKYFQELSVLRDYSEAPTNNKIRVQTDSKIYRAMYTKNSAES